MATPLQTWKVLPHGKLSVVDDNLLTVVGDLPMPLGDFPRRMTVVRLQDGRLVIYSAIALDEVEMAALEAYGRPTFLVVPSPRHRMDAKIWKDRYPGLVVVAPPGARARVNEIVEVAADDVDFDDPNVRLVTVAGTAGHEAALIVHAPSGTTLIVNELIYNLPERPGISGFLFKVMGMTGHGPHIPTLIALLDIKDKALLRRELENWAQLPSLRRIIVSHGDIIEQGPARVLHELAQRLAA